MRLFNLALSSALAACGPRPAASDPAGTSGTAETSGTTAEPTDTGSTAASCGIVWLATDSMGGRVNYLGLAPEGHTIAFGTRDYPNTSNNAAIYDFDGDGTIVRTIVSMYDDMEAGGVDAEGNMYAILDIGGTFEMRKYDVAGNPLASVDLGVEPGSQQTLELAVSPTGALTISNYWTGQITRRAPDLSVVWEITAETVVRAVNSDGSALGHRWGVEPRVVMLDANGALAWDTMVPVLNASVDLNSAGHSVIAGRTPDLDQLAVVRLDPAGEQVWSTQLTAHDEFDSISAVAINTAGTVVAIGSVYGDTVATSVLVLVFDADGEKTAQRVCLPEPEIWPDAVRITAAGEIRLGGRAWPDSGPPHAYVAAIN